ncbi:flagellar filament outer layer protein Flaa [Leptospira santarosai str. HAI134]|uniref:Flagellar filament outer layer protein Flaa n=1 Tax=Leptospira santarosai str. MOR084 TaxID=1049984 RepID=A0A0E2BJH3_9LEPT|nr:flagellar filament outer layer protein Flaa [Leptospira santarosai str. MOR084]EKR92921.1 flagellar filament outer layer protein Flaa [Leptospira santarosai str. CBC379]EMJ51495.1 flagellar filament outer layer protein Flaa [Leptospira santarosai str. HAI1349]EMO23955.1 flagellar filament outer layer protein Flaa [Leptospira santarosai str. HAI134]EMO34271.1 flagellar filament outer layer protein Flaa [Leptospira santarosai str. HAI821]EMP82268.1 flagellar filament outer layer protein Flaa 
MRALFFSRVLITLYLLSSISGQIELFSAPIKRDEDEMSRVLILEKILSEWKQYNLFLVDSFDGTRPWEIYRGVSFLNEIRFNSQIPENTAFSKEREFYPALSAANDYRSMMVQTFFENPKHAHLEIRPKEKIRLPIGIPSRIFFWMYSSSQNAKLELVLYQHKSKEIVIDLGDLNFDGWKRIEKKLMIPAKNAKLNQNLHYPFEVAEIRLIPGPFQKKGEFVFYLDRMGILVDTRDNSYPGAEIKDNWGTGL